MFNRLQKKKKHYDYRWGEKSHHHHRKSNNPDAYFSSCRKTQRSLSPHIVVKVERDHRGHKSGRSHAAGHITAISSRFCQRRGQILFFEAEEQRPGSCFSSPIKFGTGQTWPDFRSPLEKQGWRQHDTSIHRNIRQQCDVSKRDISSVLTSSKHCQQGFDQKLKRHRTLVWIVGLQI